MQAGSAGEEGALTPPVGRDARGRRADIPLPVEGSQLEAEQHRRQQHCRCRLRGSHEGCQLCQDRWLNLRGFKFGGSREAYLLGRTVCFVVGDYC